MSCCAEQKTTDLAALVIMTAMARKRNLKVNTNLRNCDYFVIIPSCSHFILAWNLQLD